MMRVEQLESQLHGFDNFKKVMRDRFELKDLPRMKTVQLFALSVQEMGC